MTVVVVLRASHRNRRSLAGLLAFAASLSGGVAYARECDREARAADPEPPSVIVVMDASKSMAKPAGAGKSRLAVAKEALRTLVSGLPEGARVGLRLYGHRVAGATRAEGCRDTELVTPIARLDRAALTAEIGSYRAVGSTPIGYALRAAAGDLPPAGATSIVLVSDGGDNCAPPDPCEVAGQLAVRGGEVSIQAIGFQVGGRARRQLRCIAERGRGVYRDAADAEQLAVALRALAARATRTYRPVGRRVAGGAGPGSAAAIGPGRFVDSIGADEERWYAVALDRGQRLAAAAVVSRPCSFRAAAADMIGTSLEVDVLDSLGESPVARSGVANLFMGDESTESDGALTQAIGPRSDSDVAAARGRFLLRVRLSDNGRGSIAEELEGEQMVLQVQANVSGEGITAPAAAGRERGGQHDSDAGTLAVVVLGCLVLGAGTSFAVVRLRRRVA